MTGDLAYRTAAARGVPSSGRRGLAKGAIATTGAALAYAAPVARRVAHARQVGSPPPGGGGSAVVRLQPAVLVPAAPAAVAPGTVVQATVDFGVVFSSITQVCLLATFIGDLFDLGDVPFYEFPPGVRYPIENVGATPFGSYSLCQLDATFNDRFLDGRQAFAISALSGTAIIQSLTVSIEGRLP